MGMLDASALMQGRQAGHSHPMDVGVALLLSIVSAET